MKMSNTTSRLGLNPPRAAGRCFRFACAIALALFLSACATSQTADALVMERAQARWDALLARDWDTAYSYFSPGYRSSHSRVDFEIAVRSRKVRWDSAEVKEISCEADVCTVTTLIGYEVVGAVPGVPRWENRKNLPERWVRTDGQWWFLPES